AIPIALAVALWSIPAGTLAALTPWRFETRVGELLSATILADSGGAEQGDAARVLSGLGDRLATLASCEHPVEFALLASPDEEIITAPGGYTIVPTGVITAAANPTELAHALARALVHTARGHTLAQAFDQLGRVTMVSLLLGSLPEFGDALPRA